MEMNIIVLEYTIYITKLHLLIMIISLLIFLLSTCVRNYPTEDTWTLTMITSTYKKPKGKKVVKMPVNPDWWNGNNFHLV